MEIGNGISAFDILQSLKMVDEPVSVVLVTDGNGRDRVGRIYLRGRKIYHVEYEDVQGLEALRYLMHHPVKKAFIVRMDRPLPYSSVSMDVDDLLLRASFIEGGAPEDVRVLDDIRGMLSREDGLIAFFVIRADEKSEMVDMVYVKDTATSSRLNLAFRALDIVKKMGEAFPECESLLCKRGEFLYYARRLKGGKYGLLISAEDVAMDILKLIMDRMQ